MFTLPVDFFELNTIFRVVELAFVIGALVLLIPFIFIMLTQLRLLNHFFKTPASSVWVALSLLLLLVTAIAGIWYFLL